MEQADWESFQKSEQLHQFNGDPEDDPYKSKYEARKFLENLLKKLENLDENSLQIDSDDNYVVKMSALCCLNYKLAINYVDCDERPEGEKIVLKICEMLEQPNTELALNPKLISLYIAAKNYLGYIYCDRSDNENSLCRLRESESIYVVFKTKFRFEDIDGVTSALYPWDLTDALHLVCAKTSHSSAETLEFAKQRWISFEKLHTYTLFYLAKLYKNLNEFSKAASCCQETLERQLEYKDYDPIEWALNAATLSQYYIGKNANNNFPKARHCLAAAWAVIEYYESAVAKQYSYLTTIVGGEKLDSDSDATKEKIAHCKADVYRCAAKYGLALLDCSREKFLARDAPISLDSVNLNMVENNANLNMVENDESESGSVIATSHRNVFVMENIAKHEKEIGAHPVHNFAEAREIFLKIQHYLNKAKEYFLFDDFCSDFVEISGDLSCAFKYLAFFETDLDRKCKMHKRRMDALDACLKELNPQYYIQICRQLTFEVGEICNEIMDLKIDIVEERANSEPNVHQISKINMLAEQGIRYFRMFLDSFSNEQGITMPTTKFEHNVVRPVCLAHFYIGRLYNKILTSDRHLKLANCQKTLENYQWIVSYCDHVDPGAIDLMKSEYDVCKDMVSLYPMKIARIREGYPMVN